MSRAIPVPTCGACGRGILCRRRKLDTAESLVAEARLTDGLDAERFRVDISSHAILEAFGSDLERAGSVAPEHFAEGSDRVKLPSLEFRGEGDGPHGVYGFAPYEALEVAAVCGLHGPRAPAELWRLATEWRVQPERAGSGELWTLD